MTKTPQEIITAAWRSVLVRPPRWGYTTDSFRALFDKVSLIGVSYDPKSRQLAVGHVTADLQFLPAAGPFDTIEEASITLIGAVANYDAAAHARG